MWWVFADTVLFGLTMFVITPYRNCQPTSPSFLPSGVDIRVEGESTAYPPPKIVDDILTQRLDIPYQGDTLSLDIVQFSKVFVEFVESPGSNLSVTLKTQGGGEGDEDGAPLTHTLTQGESGEPHIIISVGHPPSEDGITEYWPLIVSVVCVGALVILSLAIYCYKKRSVYRYRVREPEDFNTDSFGQTPVRTHQALRRVVHAPQQRQVPDRLQRQVADRLLQRSPRHWNGSHGNRADPGVTAARPDSRMTRGQPAHEDKEPASAVASDVTPTRQEVTATPQEDESEGDENVTPTFPTCTTCSRSSLTLGRASVPVYLLAITSILGIIVVASISPSRPESVLKVAVPSSTLVRNVRMYTEHPSLSDFNYNSSSLNLVSRLQLLDFSGCSHESLSKCATYAVCDSLEGAITCRCQRGYYVHTHECRACSTSCPADHFMLHSCSTSRDILCQKCAVCEGSKYEVAACTPTQDTICVEVSFPVGILPMNYSQLQDDGTVMNVSWSANMFLERLRDMEELETPMYVTNNQQSMDYVWKRTSGLQIKIGISEVYLVPEYVDLDHTDDSAFFKMNKNISFNLKQKFETTEKKYCRDPMPDFYSLYLHIFRHRITAAKSVTCDTRRQNCPLGYKDGQTHIRRYINNACHKHQINRHQNMTRLENTYNSVVCTDMTPLSLIFGMPNPASEPMRFPSEDCKFNQDECQRCLDSDDCEGHNRNVTECCNLRCYKLPTCNQAFSSSCPKPEVECATGEVFMFTLSPVFELMHKRFMCHVKYKMPPILYKINYEVRVPALSYHIEQRNFTITVDDLASHRKLSTRLDFLNVQHNTWFDFEDEMVAIADHKDIVENMGELRLHPLKKNHEFTSPPFDVKKDFGTQMFTYVQFDEPFRYSSLTWMDDACEKNLSQVFPNQTVYKPESVQVAAKILNQRDKMHYQMYRSDRSPLIRLFVNKSQSVLSTFKAELGESILQPSTLKTTVMWSPQRQIWSINVTGSMSGVPGVLGLQVFEKMMTKCIGYFDAIIARSPHFHVQFNVSSSQPGLPDIFVLLINDSITSHHVLLSSMILPQNIKSSSSASSSNILANQPHGSMSIWLPVIIITTFTFIIIAVVFVVYMFVHLRARYSVEQLEKENVLLNNKESVTVPEKVYPSSKSKTASRTVILVFILLYGAYSIIFTFSVAFGILYISHLTVLSNFTKASNLTHKLSREFQLSVEQLKQFERQEINDLKHQYKQRKDACGHHLNTENSAVLNYQVSVLEKQLQVIYVQNGSLQYLADNMARNNAAKHIEKIQAFVEECNVTVHKHFKRLTEKYYSELEEISKNGWLDFPREMFLRQKKDGYDSMSSSHLVKFMTWLQMDKADALLSVSDKITRSLSSLAPSMESLIATDINSIKPESVPHIRVSNSSLQAYKYIVMERLRSQGETTLDGVLKLPRMNSTSREATDMNLNSMMYILIGLFLIVDILLLGFRLAWLYTQVQEVREGCEELIPQDEAARKVLKTKTGQNPPRQFDLFDQQCPFTQNGNEMIHPENELNVYFCQSYPRSKEDILRDIWAQKMKTKTSKEKMQEIWLVQDIMSCMCWMHRVLLSKMFWRVLCSAAVVVFICCVMCVFDSWLCPENFHSLVGVDLMLQELEWQTQSVNQHLVAVAEAMNTGLHELKVSVDMDVENVNTVLWNTWHKQMEILMLMLSSLCDNAGTEVCDLSFLNPSHHAPLSSCNFLPLQITPYSELDLTKIQSLVISELSPLIDASRHLVFVTANVLIVLLCARVVCHVTARTVKDYLIISGRFPKARIYQFSNTMTGMSDDPNDPEKEIHRSASWLESCESGVYVGDNDDSARESTI